MSAVCIVMETSVCVRSVNYVSDDTPEVQCVTSVGAVPLATLKLVDETSDMSQETESWRHLLIHEVRSEGAQNCICFTVV